MVSNPTVPIEELLKAAYAWLREHDDGVKLSFRIGLIALSAVLGYLGIDLPDLPDSDS
jgi:hypothetical protein